MVDFKLRRMVCVHCHVPERKMRDEGKSNREECIFLHEEPCPEDNGGLPVENGALDISLEQ